MTHRNPKDDPGDGKSVTSRPVVLFVLHTRWRGAIIDKELCRIDQAYPGFDTVHRLHIGTFPPIGAPSTPTDPLTGGAGLRLHRIWDIH